jgi:hypothetical protein
MNGTRDTNETPAADRSELDPREAAKLLEQTRRQAQRELDIRPPLLMAAGAVVALIAYGVVWLSVRGQHPYEGPSAAALVVLYSTLAVWGATFATVYRRATSGVSGRTSRQRRHEGAVFGTIWVTVYVFQGALHHAGASHAIVYGIYPAAAPLIIVGAAAAAHEAATENWQMAAYAIAAVVVGALAAFAGPAAVWAIVGIGLSVLLLIRAGVQYWSLHA